MAIFFSSSKIDIFNDIHIAIVIDIAIDIDIDIVIDIVVDIDIDYKIVRLSGVEALFYKKLSFFNKIQR